ncbi:MAG: serine/threonine protein kinase [Candidatus Riflebacteria bacterium]|nr:serine/threonine protein kinase [Candidatus Riflebacteria bacterium]
MTTRYMIVEELGEGAMGTVYRAVQVDLKREVALKVLHQDVQSSLNGLHRFKREVEACAALNHPNIIRILDCDEMADGCFYYTMDLIRGLDLASLAAREAPVPADRVVALMAQAADAVAHLHDRSMLHRDIKPRNVMVDDAGRLTLMDFGLVKLHERTVLTVTGQRVGTPKYMAPELFRGEPDAPARDVYGLGLTFWELLAGRLAFPERDMQKLVTIILGRGVEPISGVRSDLPAWLVDLVTRCVAIDPRQRPTALQVKESCLGRRPVTQAPVAGAPRRSTRGAGAAPAAAVVAAPRRPPSPSGRSTGPGPRSPPGPPRRLPPRQSSGRPDRRTIRPWRPRGPTRTLP